MGWRRLAALILGLPEDASLWREVRPTWTGEHELLALGVEYNDRRLTELMAVIVKTMTGKELKLGKPLRLEHPDRPGGKRKRQPVTPDSPEAQRFFSRLGR